MTGHPDLPGVLADIAEVAGREAALEVALALGGETIHVPAPAKLTTDHVLVGAVGKTAAQAIAGRFQGDSIYIPMARRVLVRRLASGGASVREIAAQLALTRHTVRQYIRQK